MSGGGQRGFTLMEVMIALAILAGGLALSLGATVNNIEQAQRAQALGVATNLARGKMYDLEEELIHDGFDEMDQTEDGDFSDEGWPDVTWEAKIEKIELPGLTTVQSAEGAAEESGAGAAPGLSGGGGAGTDPVSMFGAGVLASQFETISSVLEMSIRRVTLTVRWKVGRREEDMVVVAYFTNEQGITQALSGLPATGAAGGASTGSGAGTGRGGSRSSGGGGSRGGTSGINNQRRTR